MAVSLYRDGLKVDQREVVYNRRLNQIRFEDSMVQEGHHRYRVALSGAGGNPVNDSLSVEVGVRGKPGILLISSIPKEGLNIRMILSTQGMAVESVSAPAAPINLADYLPYRAIILNNIPASLLSNHQMEVPEVMSGTSVEGSSWLGVRGALE